MSPRQYTAALARARNERWLALKDYEHRQTQTNLSRWCEKANTVHRLEKLFKLEHPKLYEVRTEKRWSA